MWCLCMFCTERKYLCIYSFWCRLSENYSEVENCIIRAPTPLGYIGFYTKILECSKSYTDKIYVGNIGAYSRQTSIIVLQWVSFSNTLYKRYRISMILEILPYVNLQLAIFTITYLNNIKLQCNATRPRRHLDQDNDHFRRSYSVALRNQGLPLNHPSTT